MARRPPRTSVRPAIESEEDALALLGLPARASSRDIESAHERIVAFLAEVPPHLRSWALQATEEADAAYARLSDPATESGSAEGTASAAPAVDDSVGEASGSAAGVADAPSRLGRRRVVVAAALVAALAVGIVVYRSGGDSPASPDVAADAPAQAASTADPDRVAELTAAVKAKPKDVASHVKLGELYFAAGDYQKAAEWMERALKVRPSNTTARLALGAAWFNLGKRAQAEREWKRVVATNPKNVEAHYDLGFLYLSANPPDMARVRAEWGKVVELAPKSEVAKTVAAHLDQFDTADPAAGGAGGTP